MARGSHYPTDVGAGGAIGFLGEWAVSKLMGSPGSGIDGELSDGRVRQKCGKIVQNGLSAGSNSVPVISCLRICP
ncbi:MAG: hypothetical protein V4726_22450 [Verrucomicrobiota bacterium]